MPQFSFLGSIFVLPSQLTASTKGYKAELRLTECPETPGSEGGAYFLDPADPSGYTKSLPGPKMVRSQPSTPAPGNSHEGETRAVSEKEKHEIGT